VTGDRACAGFVLAGGASSRFGRDKALVQMGGEPLLMRLYAVLREVTPSVAVIGAEEKYGGLGVTCVADRWPGEGPLGGILTALEASAQDGDGDGWNLIIGCDMPFLTREWLAYIVERAAASTKQVVTPRSRDRWEPLCACWRTSGRAALQGVFDEGVRKITEAMKHVSVEILDETHWKRFDSADRLFWNMNTLADYNEAKRIVDKGRV
jgi:molybdopterin-guanine dinucleotide biosynthesis protein A